MVLTSIPLCPSHFTQSPPSYAILIFIFKRLYAYVHPACSHIKDKKKASQKGGSVHFVLILMIVLILFSLRRRVGVD